MKIKKIWIDEETDCLEVDFEHNGQEASFSYSVFGEERRINDCDYEEDTDENIYEVIHNWVDKHIKTEFKVLCDGKEIERRKS